MERGSRIERNLGWIAVPNLIIYLVLGQIIVWVLQTFLNYPMGAIALIPAQVRAGEVWRLVTFAFFPPQGLHPIFLIFAWYILFMMGNALEHFWGSFRFTLYVVVGLLLATVATVIALFLNPYWPITNLFISTSIFLAFAHLNGDFEFLLFFIIPVKVKWLAVLTWAMLAAGFVLSPLMGKVVILAGVGNFFIFFGPGIIRHWRGKGAVAPRAKTSAKGEPAAEAFHTCSICGVTDIDEPDLLFVYSEGNGICERCLKEIEDGKSSES